MKEIWNNGIQRMEKVRFLQEARNYHSERRRNLI
jgi:hypothetical protein